MKREQEHCDMHRRRNGFTLIELLVVISIIMILFGLLIPVLGLVRKRARVIEAKKDVNEIEAALNEYLATYRRWPTFGAGSTPITPIRVADDMADLLVSGAYDDVDNPKRLTFMNFKRFNESGTPITPWANEDIEDSAEIPEHYYYVMFDTDFDNTIGGCSGLPSIDEPSSNDVHRSVIVWTANTDATPGDRAYIIGSWE